MSAVSAVLIRHGKTPGNERHCYIGRTDEPLLCGSPAACPAGTYPAAELLFVSPMLRCRQTAEIIYPGQEQIVVENFSEMDFGDFEGENFRDLAGNPAYQAWIDSGGTLPFPNGESREHFVERTLAGFYGMLHTVRRRGAASLAAVVHGGTIMAVLSSFAGGDYFDYQVKNGEGYAFTVRGDGGAAIFSDLRRL